AYPECCTLLTILEIAGDSEFVSRGCCDPTIKWLRFWEMVPSLRMHSQSSGGKDKRREMKSAGILTPGAFRIATKYGTKRSATLIGFGLVFEKAIEPCPDISKSGAPNLAGCTTMRPLCESSMSWESRSILRRYRESLFREKFQGQTSLFGYMIGWTRLKNHTIPVRDLINVPEPMMRCACWKYRIGPSHLG